MSDAFTLEQLRGTAVGFREVGDVGTAYLLENTADRLGDSERKVVGMQEVINALKRERDDETKRADSNALVAVKMSEERDDAREVSDRWAAEALRLRHGLDRHLLAGEPNPELYPNLHAMLSGRVSGPVSDWIGMSGELRRLLAALDLP